jgi:hypothetical protein
MNPALSLLFQIHIWFRNLHFGRVLDSGYEEITAIYYIYHQLISNIFNPQNCMFLQHLCIFYRL